MSINLSSLNGSNGFLLDGNAAGDLSGWWVSEAGDVNGDGMVDLVMGARTAHGSGANDSGIVYVVYGSTTPFPADFDVTSIDGTNGFLIEGDEWKAQLGRSVSSAGDFNNDGFDDLIIGSWLANGNGKSDSGEAYVIYGKAGGYSAGLTPSDIDGTNGFRIDGTARQDWSGWSVSGAGDVNNDGIDDIVLGNWGDDPSGKTNAGTAQVIYGSANPFGGAASVDQSALTLADGVRIEGTNGTVDTGTYTDPGDGFGYAVSGAGDINGDGIDDFIVGANRDNAGGDPYAGEYDYGAAYVIFGETGGWSANFSSADIDGTNGFALPGYKTKDRSGYSVAEAGDVNNDGYADVIMGNREIDTLTEAGEAYLIYGSPNAFPASFDLTMLDGTNGTLFTGAAAGDYTGGSVNGAGDFNGDGIDDIIIGAQKADVGGNVDAGKSYILFGKTGGFGAHVDLGTITDADGLVIDGIAAGDWSGRQVSKAGDLNGDGLDDIVIGAYFADGNGNADAGQTYVVYGSRYYGTAVQNFDLTVSANYGPAYINYVDPVDKVVAATASSGASISFSGAFGEGITYTPAPAGTSDLVTITLETIEGDQRTQTLSIGIPIMTPTSGNDTLTGTAGDDIIDLLEGDDVFAAIDGNDSVNGNLGNDSIIGDIGNDTLMGDDGNDTLRGDAGADSLEGGAGDDSIEGGSDNDTINGGDGGDTLRGEDGNDVISGDAGDDLINSGDGNDSILGGDGNDTLNLFPGDDTAFGGAGDDEIFADLGDDLISGGTGNDSINGGGGSDTISGDDGNDTINGGGAGPDSVDGGAGDDFITSGISSDILNGGADNDTINGGQGDDTLNGDDGDDVLIGGIGADTIDGGVNTAAGDTLSYSNSNMGVVVDLGAGTASGGDATGDVFSNVENLTGSVLADSLDGDANGNALDGLNGDDTIHGHAGDDNIAGGFGQDELYGGDGDDTLSGQNADDQLFGEAGNDFVSGGIGSDYLAGGDGDDTMLGEGNNDTLIGGLGEDSLSGGSGDDVFDGGDGNDRMQGQGNDDFASGGAGDDTILGQAGSDTINGDAGQDSIDGGGGADVLDGGDGDDFIDGGTARDLLDGGTGSDILNGGGGIDTINGGADNDTISGGSGNDLVDGGDGDDIINGDGGFDTLTGGSGNDTLDGGQAADILNGGLGADSVAGGNGNDLFLINAGEGGDSLSGGTGADTFDFETGFISAVIEDFQDGSDLIDLVDVTAATSFADLVITYGVDATIDLGAGDTITLTGITGGLDDTDFTF